MKRLTAVIICMFFALTMQVHADEPFSDYGARSLFLMETSGSEVLYEYNADDRLPIASVTKIMTMLLAMEAIDSGKAALDDLVTVSERAMNMGGSTMFLETGEKLTVSDLLKGIAVASANDGAVAMAEFICGSESAFVDKMNERARTLGMTNTNFVNTNGLDADGHYSSARDVAIMSRELLKHEEILKYTTIWTDSLRDGKFRLANTNKLIRFYDGANGLKTGSTSKALCCISASAKREDMQLVAVVLGAPNSKERFATARGLLDYGFANYAVENIAAEGDKLAVLPIAKGKNGAVDLLASEDCKILVKKENKGKAEQSLKLPQTVTAPAAKGESVGKLEVYIDGEIIKSIDAVIAEDVEKKSFFDFVADACLKLISC